MTKPDRAARPELQHLARTLIRHRQHHTPALTQAQAAELIGISERHLARLESAEAKPGAGTLAKITRAYHLDTNTLLNAAEPTTLERIEAKLDQALTILNNWPNPPTKRIP